MKSALGWSDDDDDSFEENEEESEKQEGPVRNKNTSGEISEDEQESESNGNAFFAEVLSDFQDQVGQWATYAHVSINVVSMVDSVFAPQWKAFLR